MSIDITLTDPETDEQLFWRNHTSNTRAMWNHAGADLHDVHGKTGADLAALVAPALAVIDADPKSFKQFEADNGWGTVLSTREFLRALVDAGLAHPTAVVDVCV